MAKTNPRAKRLGEQIQRELTELLRREVKDERIGNVTITAVTVTGDLRTARVYYLIFGREGADIEVQRGLTSAAGFLRNALSKSLMIRFTPTLSFELDTSIEHGVRLTQLIDAVNKPLAATPADALPDDDGHVVDAGDYVPTAAMIRKDPVKGGGDADEGPVENKGHAGDDAGGKV